MEVCGCGAGKGSVVSSLWHTANCSPIHMCDHSMMSQRIMINVKDSVSRKSKCKRAALPLQEKTC
jgi:hypothetical protein